MLPAAFRLRAFALGARLNNTRLPAPMQGLFFVGLFLHVSYIYAIHRGMGRQGSRAVTRGERPEPRTSRPRRDRLALRPIPEDGKARRASFLWGRKPQRRPLLPCRIPVPASRQYIRRGRLLGPALSCVLFYTRRRNFFLPAWISAPCSCSGLRLYDFGASASPLIFTPPPSMSRLASDTL